MFKYVLIIEGMKCSMCESHINDVIRKNFNVKKVKSKYKKNMTTFVSEELISDDLIKSVISSTGYKLISVDFQ